MSQEPAGLRTGTWVRLIVLTIAVLLLVIFIVQNRAEVQVHFIFGSLETRLVWALLLAAVLGFLIGWLGPRLVRNRT